jgi:hypothetical protein
MAAAAANPNEIFVTFDKHPLNLVICKGSGKICNKCFGGNFGQGVPKYQCKRCDTDICMACYHKMISKSKGLEVQDKSRLHQMLDDPKERLNLITTLTEASGALENPGEKVAFELAIKMLKDPKVNSEQLIAVVSKLAAKEALGEVKAEVAKEIGQELGLSAVDISGVLSAISLIRSIAKGDLAGVAKSAASMIAAKVILGLLCVIQ